MGALGLGTNVDPNAYGQNNNTAPALIQQAVPGYQAPPFMEATNSINWNPAVTRAWGDPGSYVSSWDTNRRGGIGGAMDDIGGGPKHTPEYTARPWQNPLSTFFGSGGMFNLQGTPGSGSQYTQPSFYGSQGSGRANDNHYSPTFGYQGGTSNPAYQNQFGYNPNDKYGSTTNPQTFQELMGQINGLQGSDMQALTNNWSGTQAGFKDMAQEYSNAYANGSYAKQNPLRQDQTQDWLQASYNTLTGKMNSAYLL